LGIRVPDRENITATTPLRLETAVKLAFPDGSMSVSALRRLAVGGKVTHEVIAGKYFITLAAIEEMRERCRVPAKAPASVSRKAAVEPHDGSSGTDSESLALAAMNATAQALKESLRNTSSLNTIRPKPSTRTIPTRPGLRTSSPSK
jgi:hypothetical protein